MSAHGWMPVSPCGDPCVEREVPQVSAPRAAWRAIAAASVLIAGLGLLLVPRGVRRRLLRGWIANLLRAGGVRIEVHGAAKLQATSGRGVLVATNHVSWMDCLAVSTVQPMPMVAKRDIRNWPVLGKMIEAAGGVFIDRERLKLLPRTVGNLANALRSGSAVGFNPEGTTSCGLVVAPFKPALFQAALDAGVPVRPVAIRYRLPDSTTTPVVAFVGDVTILDSARKVLRMRGLVIELHVLPEVAPGRAEGRAELAKLTESVISSALRIMPDAVPARTRHYTPAAA